MFITPIIQAAETVNLKSQKMSETFLISAILAVVGGFLDAYTYICRGSVFANAQTGNIVLLGIKLAEGSWQQAIRYLTPILSFVVGIMLTEAIKRKYREGKMLHWRQIVVVMEFIVIMSVGFIPAGKFNVIANILVSFICAMQVESFRKVNGKTYASTMCTGNLRSGTELLYRYHRSKDKNELKNSLEYFGIILFFILGAVIGTVFSHIFYIKAILFTCILLFIAFLLMFKK